MKSVYLTLLFTQLAIFAQDAFGVETCGRTAIINHQEILVDHDSTKKGEGLRHHIKKDPVAENYLNLYQDGTKIKIANAIVGTAGSLTFLTGLLVSDSGNSKKTMMIGGAALIIVNFLMAKTLEHKNEEYLTRSIEEYNRRNPSKIYFGPSDIDNDNDSSNKSNVNNDKNSFFLNLTREF